MAALRLASCNIERSKHLPLVQSFLEAERPDVFCVQELLEPDCQAIASYMGAMWHSFVPMSRVQEEVPGALYGVGIFSKLPVAASGTAYYLRGVADIPEHPIEKEYHLKANHEHRVVLWADITDHGETFRIGTTHFTWSYKGAPSDLQRQTAAKLFAEMEPLGELILVGDFNAPRIYNGEPGEIFSMFATQYKDNIPQEYGTSIDGSLHRAGQLPFMVDGLFSTPGYVVSDVTLHAGVSDHCAVTGMVRLVT